MRNASGINLVAGRRVGQHRVASPNCSYYFSDEGIDFSSGVPGHGYALETLNIEDDRFFFYFEGVLLDLHGFESAEEYFADRLAGGGLSRLTEEINGSFVAVHFCRYSKKLSVFADHLATRKIFYRMLEGGGVAVSTLSSDLLVDSLGSLTLDQESVYGFLGYGFFLDNTTYWEEVKTLRAGEVLEFDHSVSVRKWCDLSPPMSSLQFDEAVEEFDRYFSRAMNSIVKVCSQPHRAVIAAISGGLDSRAALIALTDLGCVPDYTVTFSQSGASDERIAVQVANSLGVTNILNRLDGGWYLMKGLRDYVIASQGRLSYHTAIHGYDTYSKLRPVPSTLLLSGQIGDVLFGSFLRASLSYMGMRSFSYSYVKDDYIHEKIGLDKRLFELYRQRGAELFNLEQRQSNGTITGDLFIRQYFDTVSPFFDRDLVRLSLSMPPDFRSKNRLQFAWMNRFHRNMTAFKWDKSGLKPRWRIANLLACDVKRVVNRVRSKLSMARGMNPFQFWLRENAKLGSFLDAQIEAYLGLGKLPDSLVADLKRLSVESSAAFDMRRTAVLTVLLVVHEMKPTSGSGVFGLVRSGDAL